MEKVNWKETMKNLGNIKEGTVVTFDFESTEPLEILETNVSCSNCTTILGYKDNKLTIKFDASVIPITVLSQPDFTGILPFVKNILVKYKDGTEEVLTFFGNKVKK